jgi:hypothetical protein
MMFVRYSDAGTQQFVNFRNVFQGRTVILMGAAPSIAEQPLHLLEQRGVLVAAMNNAAIHLRPTLWFSADNPKAFEPQVIQDPTILKFAPTSYSSVELPTGKYRELSNLYFYFQDERVMTGEMFDDNVATPWYRSTMFSALTILVHMGVSRIILGGSDLEFHGARVYAHDTELTEEEKKTNTRMYTGLAIDLAKIDELLKDKGVEFMDCSANSKLAGIYPVISMQEAVELALEDFPDKMMPSRTYRHGTNFTPRQIKQDYRGIPDDNFDLPVIDDSGMEELT